MSVQSACLCVLVRRKEIRASVAAGCGVHVNAQDELGETPLHWAQEWQQIKAVRLLVDAGADPTLNGWQKDYISANKHMGREIQLFRVNRINPGRM